MGLFQSAILKKYLKGTDDKISVPYQQYAAYFHNPEIQENIRNSKEEQFQEGFLRELFVKILGYTLNPQPNFNLITEKKSEVGAKKADGAMLVNGEVVGVIELKDGKTTDLKQVEAQAFGYKNYHRKASYVVISNFEKLRFYIDNALDFIEFNLFSLSKEDFAVLWLCLAYDSIESNLPKQIKTESVSSEDQVTKQLYKEYSTFKRALFDDLTKLNPGYDRLTLFKRSQKLLDRLLFILFAEDCGLLPPNSIVEIVRQWESLKEMDAYSPLYERLKKYFGYMNTGYKGKKHDIFAYNGGLFKPDEVLDNIQISDEVLYPHLQVISRYDFSSEVDVNILGHIFENSLTEIEEITHSITTKAEPKTTGKRKKDGVFYTPRYITAYIVENTLGKLCADKKAEIEINESEYFADKKRQKATKLKLDQKLIDYRNWLLSLTICDPACGSGAFLNAALDFLIAEHKLIDEMYAKIHNVPIVFSDIENAILENNLYGVDINEESVEIAKLALWLRTAKPNRKLNSLNENIKCGNSLISDPEVAGDKAFDWHKAFPQVFRKGGFDVVIGNPPWGARINETEKKVLSADFSFIGGKNSDTYMYFIFKIIDILKVEGFMGVIIPNTWMLINSGVDIRRKILNYDIKEIIDYGDGVFEDATVESMTIVLKKALSDNELVIKRQKGNLELSCNIIKKEIWEKHSDCRILVDLTNDISILIDKIHLNTKCFSEIGEIIWGIKPYQVGHGYPRQTKEMQNERVYHSKTKYNEKWKPLVVGSNVDRYVFDKEKVEYILYGKNLMYMSNEDKIKQPKLLMRQTSDILRVCYDDESYYPQNSIFIITSLNDNVINLKYLMLLLNSTLFRLIYKIQNPQTGKIFAEIKPSIIKKLPIKHISLPHQQPFIIKAGQMLSLNAEWQTRRQRFLRRLTGNLTVTRGHAPLLDATDFKHFLSELKKQKITLSLKQQDEWEEYFNNYKSECNNLSTQIAETDKTIDRMVYELYGLTEEEIDMIENRN